MARNKSELRARIERLLDANQNNFKTTSQLTKNSVMAALVASVLAVPALALGESNSKDDDAIVDVIVKRNVETTKHTYRRSVNGHDKSVSVEGEFALANDGLHIGKLSPDGYFEISEKGSSDIDRFYKISDNNGTLVYTFKRNGRTEQMNDEDKKWLASMMLDYHRNNGRTAKQRVKFLENKGGLDAVFDEMQHVSKSAVRYYSSTLLNSYSLSDDQQINLLQQIARNDSNYELRMALKDWLLKSDLSDDVEQKALQIMARIKSDYEMRTLLSALLEKEELDDNAFKRFITLSKTVGSDYEMRRLITTALQTQLLSNADNLEQFVDLAKSRIGSDYEMRQLIKTMTHELKDHNNQAQTVIKALENIGSDYEMRQAISQIISSLELQQDEWLDLIATLNQMGSDYEMTKTLMNILAKIPQDQVLIDAVSEMAKNNLSSRDSINKMRQALADVN